MSDVSARVVRLVVDLARQEGLPPARVFGGRPPTGLSSNRFRISWSEFAAMLRRINEEVGGPEGLEAAAARSWKANPDLKLLSRLFSRPAELLRFLVRRLFPACLPHCQFKLKRLDARRCRVIVELSRHCEDAPELAFLHAGCLRAFPTLLGMGEAAVETIAEPYRFRHVVTLPRATKAAAAKHKARAVAPEVVREVDGLFAEVGTAYRTLVRFAATRSSEQQRADAVAQLGAALASTSDRVRRAQLIANSLYGLRGCARVEIRGGDGLVVKAGDSAPVKEELVRELFLGGKRVGQIKACFQEPSRDHELALDRLAPWAAIGIAAGVDGDKLQPRDGDDYGRRFKHATTAWNLTDRQQQVLALLVRGKSNKEIAAALHCAERTVEIHVTQLLRKSRADSRAMITARFWTEL